MKRPIVVTGSHRSGTTWVGRMLCLSGEAGYIHEPLNPVRIPSWFRTPTPYWYTHISDDNAHQYESEYERVFRFRYPLARNLARVRRPPQIAILVSDVRHAARPRLTRARPLVKDPFALFASEWLQRRYDADVVVTVRRPVAFVGSIKRLDWRFKFKTMLSQARLLRDWLQPFEADMRRCRDTDVDVVEQGIVLWNALHYAIDGLRRRHPDWAVVRHEDLATDPVGGFTALYEHCGLRWNGAVEDRLRGYMSADRGEELPMWRHGSVKRDSRAATQTWRTRLTPEEIDRVRSGTAEVAAKFYAD